MSMDFEESRSNLEIVDKNPIFVLHQSHSFRQNGSITHLQVSNNVVVVALTNNILLRFEIGKDAPIEEIKVSRELDDLVHNLFLDPTGRHIIISMQSGENLYLSRNSKTVRAIVKAKGHLIDSVGWNRHNMEVGNTREILIGTNAGLLFETQIIASDEGKFFNTSVEQYWHQHLQLSPISQPITGIEVERMVLGVKSAPGPSGAPSSGTDYRYFILVTTPGRFYQFLGTIPSKSTDPPIFHNVFAPFEKIPGGAKFIEFPLSFGYSDLRLYQPKFRSLPDSFAWMTGPGVYYGGIDASGNLGPDSVTSNPKLISYPVIEGERPGLPLAMVLTQFHILIAYTDRLKAISILTDEVVYSHDTGMDLRSKTMGITRDSCKGSVWLHTENSIYEIQINRESRDVWLYYLDRKDFKLARNYCQTPEQEDRVTIREAEYLYEKGEYTRSAELFAQTSLLFEEVALKFIHFADKEPLKLFLLSQVSSLNGRLLSRRLATEDDSLRPQMALLSVWLVEIFLNQLGRLRDAGAHTAEVQQTVQRQFRKFLLLPSVKETLSESKQTIYNLMESHGSVQDIVYFADLMQDYERVVRHHIQEDNFAVALQVLTNHGSAQLHYRYGPNLVTHFPKETINCWIKLGRALKPEKLLPSLLKTHPEEALRYLEFAVDQLHSRDQNVHNLLVSVYAKVGARPLLAYLEREGQEAYAVPYDPQYAMRVCAEHHHVRASVFLHSMLGMHQEAVEDALQQDDIKLAKEITRNEMISNEVKKQLWLSIAQYVVRKKSDVKEATEIVDESKLLKLEDILPFFPDFVTIDHFKDAICGSLDYYNKHIESLKDDMVNTTERAAEIRSQIQSFRLRYATVEVDSVCAECNFPLLLRTFYLFPCGHFFHTDCLAQLMKPYLSPSKLSRFNELTAALSNEQTPGTVQAFRIEYEEIIASDCFFCGQVAIDSVDRLFIDPKDYEAQRATWD